MKIRYEAVGFPPVQVQRDDSEIVHVPPRWTIYTEAGEGERSTVPQLRIQLEARDEAIRVTEVALIAQPDGPGVRSSDLKRVRLDDWIDATIGLVSWRMTSQDGENYYGPLGKVGTLDMAAADAAMRTYLRTKGRPPKVSAGTERHRRLAEVASLYRDNLDDRPTVAVAARFGIKHRTAQQWVKECRDTTNPETGQNYLGPATRGKASA